MHTLSYRQRRGQLDPAEAAARRGAHAQPLAGRALPDLRLGSQGEVVDQRSPMERQAWRAGVAAVLLGKPGDLAFDRSHDRAQA